MFSIIYLLFYYYIILLFNANLQNENVNIILSNKHVPSPYGVLMKIIWTSAPQNMKNFKRSSVPSMHPSPNSSNGKMKDFGRLIEACWKEHWQIWRGEKTKRMKTTKKTEGKRRGTTRREIGVDREQAYDRGRRKEIVLIGQEFKWLVKSLKN